MLLKPGALREEMRSKAPALFRQEGERPLPGVCSLLGSLCTYLEVYEPHMGLL